MEKLKEFKDVELYYQALSPVNLLVYTDIVGGVQGAVTLAATLVYPATVGRQTLTLPLDDIFGTLIRFKATSAGIVELFGGIYRAKAIGVWFNGARGEFWSTQDEGIGIG
jgi:hypothetical protein